MWGIPQGLKSFNSGTVFLECKIVFEKVPAHPDCCSSSAFGGTSSSDRAKINLPWTEAPSYCDLGDEEPTPSKTDICIVTVWH